MKEGQMAKDFKLPAGLKDKAVFTEGMTAFSRRT